MKLSKRLETIASFVHKGSIIADIGTDHGYIPIRLVQDQTVPRAYAMDVRKGPLERASAHVRECGLEEKITLRLSDGLEKLQPGEADTVIIAGMGGELICRILEAGSHVRDSVSDWILSPQSELGSVRRYLEQAGFSIVRETMVKEDGKYYTVMEARKGRMHLEMPWYYEYGKCLIRENHPVLAEYLEKEKHSVRVILDSLENRESESAVLRRRELIRTEKMIEEAQHEMQGID